MIPAPGGHSVLVFLGWPEDPALRKQADHHAETVARMARAYTRGNGFQSVPGHNVGPLLVDVEEDVAAVIVTAAARLLPNPSQGKRIESGSFNAAPGVFAGWTLAELGVLHRYRRRSA